MSLTAILPLIFGGIAGGSNLSASIINREQSRGDIDRQNEYNAPINQLARLREAGFPMAAGFQGGVTAGSQSALPQTSGAAASNAIAGFISTAVQLKQLKLLDAQIAKTEQDAESVAIDNQIKNLDPYQGEPVSYAARKAKLDVQFQQLQYDMSKNRYEIEKIDYDVKQQLHRTGHLTGEVRQRVLNMFWQMEGMKQLYRTNEMRIAAEKTLIEQLQKDGMSVGEAFIHMLMTGGLRNFTPSNQ